MADSSISPAGEAIARMDDKIKAKNDLVSLAWGITMVKKQDIDECIRIADEKMYKYKRKIKS
ncbi:MAG: hypothetical protein K9H14_06525 [Actinomycetia bacterium]|nr:hypothetical protein [Actinomycetes bacterium]